MKTFTHFVVTGLAAVAFSAPAFAQYSGTLGNWFTTGTPTTISAAGEPDLFFTPIQNGSPPGVDNRIPVGAVAFDTTIPLEITYVGIASVYAFNMTGLANRVALNTTYALQYYVDVDGWFGPVQHKRLGQINAGINVSGATGPYTFTKHIVGVTPGAGQNPEDPNDPVDNTWDVFGDQFDDTLSTIGNQVQTTFCGSCTRFLVTDILTVAGTVGTTTVNSMTNQFTLVPEPMTLALFGTGLVGVGFARRRRQAKAG